MTTPRHKLQWERPSNEKSLVRRTDIDSDSKIVQQLAGVQVRGRAMSNGPTHRPWARGPQNPEVANLERGNMLKQQVVSIRPAGINRAVPSLRG